MTSQAARMQVVTSTMQAADCILDSWPINAGPKLSIAKHALLKRLEGKMSQALRLWPSSKQPTAKEEDIWRDLEGLGQQKS
ncbi:DUF982 domain-containing protein [Phyllobacterium sp. K27]